jgi:hypothetical protein
MKCNPILIGKAEEIDMVQPCVRQVLSQNGIWIGGAANPPHHPGELP